MRLIVGLGNPGREYAWTRHNMGWQVVAYLSDHWGIPLGKKGFEAVWGQGRVGGESVILAQPTSYMNLSGRSVGLLLSYFKLTPKDLLVIHDDLDVPPWRLKIVERGGAGGHRGIASIIGQLHTEEFLRVKMGIGRPPPPMPAESFVLSHFPADAAEDVAQFIERAAAAVECLVKEGLQEAQNRFHGSNDLGGNGEKGKSSD